jgi:hypothetical protein
MLVRSDDGVAIAGKSAALPFDVSPVRIGMRGKVGDHGFEVIGRVRWGWTDGSWNEWLLLFDDGTDAWLGDAMGQFMLMGEEADVPADGMYWAGRVQSGHYSPGTEVTVGDEKWIVGDAREVICLAAEGELSFTPKPGFKSFSIDLKRGDGEFASLQRDEYGSEFYRGRYVTLADLHPSGLREIEGWALPSYAA